MSSQTASLSSASPATAIEPDEFLRKYLTKTVDQLNRKIAHLRRTGDENSSRCLQQLVVHLTQLQWDQGQLETFEGDLLKGVCTELKEMHPQDDELGRCADRVREILEESPNLPAPPSDFAPTPSSKENTPEPKIGEEAHTQQSVNEDEQLMSSVRIPVEPPRQKPAMVNIGVIGHRDFSGAIQLLDVGREYDLAHEVSPLLDQSALDGLDVDVEQRLSVNFQNLSVPVNNVDHFKALLGRVDVLWLAIPFWDQRKEEPTWFQSSIEVARNELMSAERLKSASFSVALVLTKADCFTEKSESGKKSTYTSFESRKAFSPLRTFLQNSSRVKDFRTFPVSAEGFHSEDRPFNLTPLLLWSLLCKWKQSTQSHEPNIVDSSWIQELAKVYEGEDYLSFEGKGLSPESVHSELNLD